MEVSTLDQIIKFDGDKFTGIIEAQVESVTRKPDGGCGFIGVELANEKSFRFNLFNDSNLVEEFKRLTPSQYIRLKADFRQNGQWLNAYPMDIEVIETPAPTPPSPEKQAEIDKNWSLIIETIKECTNPTLKAICGLFLRDHKQAFTLSAAARGHHHAEKHGLLRHTAEMLEIAINLSNVSIYKDLNWDLIFTSIVLHDSAKIFENNYEGIAQKPTKYGKLGGHIANGVSLVDKYYRTLPEGCEDSYQHLRHMILSHHGQADWGSPVDPLTSEAILLHHIDNLNAKVEPTLGVEESGSFSSEGDGIYRSGKVVIVSSLPKV